MPRLSEVTLLERFKLDESSAVRVREEPLRMTVTQIFRKMGVPENDCRLAADVLVLADLRGVDTHGVSEMLRLYVRSYGAGDVNPRPAWHIVRETPSTASIDCDRGLGIILAPKGMQIAIEKAKKVGVGVVTLRNGRHLGMASYHAMMALEHDMIGMCMTSGRPAVVLPTFGAEPRFGTNPIAIAAPAEDEPPFVFDAATSAIAANKLRLALTLDRDLLPGWVADAEGAPIMEETPPPLPGPDGIFPRRLLPLGSTRELGSHKGYGLLAMVEVLSGILAGRDFADTAGPPTFSHYVAAYSIEAFMDTGAFKRTMDQWLRTLRDTPPAPGHDRVLYPGLSEHETEQDRRANGIPLHRDVVDWFRRICGELSIPFTLTED